MEQACDYYREQLKSSPRAIEYLKGRGLTGKIAARFGIGYAPEGWQNLEGVFQNYADRALKDAGLVIDAEGGRRYDRFRDRIAEGRIWLARGNLDHRPLPHGQPDR